jgi:alcohol dehydrogenase (cytochrome c)
VLVGTGDDLDSPGFLQSFDPRTGDLQWKYYSVPMDKGDPGLETWASLDAARHGGAQVCMAGSYDPETHLYIFGTGNPTPAYTATCCGAAHRRHEPLHLLGRCGERRDGKMAWYFRPHLTTHTAGTRPSRRCFDGVFRKAAEDGDAGRSERLLLRAGPHQW